MLGNFSLSKSCVLRVISIMFVERASFAKSPKKLQIVQRIFSSPWPTREKRLAKNAFLIFKELESARALARRRKHVVIIGFTDKLSRSSSGQVFFAGERY